MVIKPILFVGRRLRWVAANHCEFRNFKKEVPITMKHFCIVDSFLSSLSIKWQVKMYAYILFILKENDLLQFVIPHKHRPGTDVMSKLMPQDWRVMNLILKTLIGTLTIRALSPFQLITIKEVEMLKINILAFNLLCFYWSYQLIKIFYWVPYHYH